MIKTLIKLRLMNFISGVASKNKKGEFQKPSPIKLLLFVLLYTFVGIMFAFMATMMVLGVGVVLIPAGLSAHYFGIVSALTFAVVFIFSIFETKAELFDCKDNELILSMPIKPGSVVVARILVVLIYNYLISALFAIPSTVIYAVFSGGDIKGIIGSLLCASVIPLAATALASAVGYAVAIISKKMKNKTFASLFFSVLFLALYFWGYSALLGTAEGDDITGAIIQLTENIGFVASLGEASLLKPLNTAVCLVSCIAVSVIAYLVISRFYFSIIMANYSTSRTKYKKKELKKSSSVAALTRKEFSKFLSSSTYMLNTGLGLLFVIALGIFLLVKSDVVYMLVAEISLLLPGLNVPVLLSLAFTVMTILISSTVTISSPALSLEGDNLWILKSMPLASRDVLISKAMPHIIISAPVMLVASLLFIIACPVGFLPSLIAIIFPQIANLIFAFFGVIMNVAFPKFKFNNEVEPIKQSASVFLAMLAPFVLAVVCGVLAVLGAMFALEWLMTLIVFVVLLSLAAGFYFILTLACTKRYESF